MFLFRRSKKTHGSHTAAQKRRFVRGMPLSLEVLESRIVLDAYLWVGGSGNWNDANNWFDENKFVQPKNVPGFNDTAFTNSSNQLFTITIPSGYHAGVQNLTTSSNYTLSIQGGSLMVDSGTSTLNGPLTMSGSGSFLFADTINTSPLPAKLTVNGATTIADADLLAYDGATLSLPQLTSYTGDNNRLVVDNGGTLNLPALKSITQNGSLGIGGPGNINLSALQTITQNGSLSIDPSGGNIDLSSLSGLSGGDVSITDMSTDGNSQMQIGNFATSLSSATIKVNNNDLQTAASAWTAISNSQVTISGGSYSLSGLNDVDGSTLNVSSTGNLNFSSSSFSVNNTTIQLTNGGTLGVGSSTTPMLNGEWTLDTSGGGQLNFPSVTRVSGDGTIDLKLASGTSGNPPSIDLSEPNDQTATVGQTATFSSPASGNPSPTHQWQLSTDQGKTWSNINGATADTLVLNNVSLAMNGNQYRDVISDSALAASTSPFSIATDASTLTVLGIAPSVTTNPNNQTVNVAQNATFTAAANGNPAPGVQWQVSTNGGKTFANINGATSTTLTLTSVTASMEANEYRAVFGNNYGSATTSPAILTVDVAPSVATNPSNQTVTVGHNVAFTAAAVGNPLPTVQWQVSTDGGKTFSNISGATSITLILTGVTAAMNGNKYHAVFSNSLGNATTSVASLTVQDAVAPPPSSQPPPSPPSQTAAITSPFQAFVAIYLDLEALTFSSDPAVYAYLNSLSESMLGQPLPPVADLVSMIEADLAELVSLLSHAV